MRIGIDMLANQSASRHRGIGRYACRLVRYLIEQHPEHQYVLYFYEGFEADRDWPAQAIVRRLPCGPAETMLHHSADEMARSNPDGLDLLLLSCALENFAGYMPPYRPANGLRVAAVLYDLIPSLFPEHYLHAAPIRKAWWRALRRVARYDALLAISESSRQDCIRLMKVAPRRVVNIGAAVDGSFFAAGSAGAGPEDSPEVLHSLGISCPFVFCLSAMDYRKNHEAALEAFALLPPWLAEAHQLVLACARTVEDAERVRELAARLGVESRLVLPRNLSDAALRQLYQRCAAFLFPSRYEGFGLPLLEAMHAGAPVIAGRNSAQIEVVGEGGLLVNVDDTAELAAALSRVLSDGRLAGCLRERGKLQAAGFNWQRTAERCHEALLEAARSPTRRRWRRMLAWQGITWPGRPTIRN